MQSQREERKDLPARNESDTNRPDRQSRKQQSSKSHNQTA